MFGRSAGEAISGATCTGIVDGAGENDANDAGAKDGDVNGAAGDEILGVGGAFKAAIVAPAFATWLGVECGPNMPCSPSLRFAVSVSRVLFLEDVGFEEEEDDILWYSS
jgi:hypothetical protein